MDNFLQKGDKFTSEKLGSMLYGNVVYDPVTGEPYVDFSKLSTGNITDVITVYWTEYKDDGWKRERQDQLHTKVTVEALCNAIWVVLETKLSGSGCGHGAGDVYPDGHFVTAQRYGGSEVVTFYQSGCFRGMIEPKDITLS